MILLRPPLFLVIGVLLATFISASNLYGYYFDIDNHHKKYQKRINDLHPQYPFRNHAIKLVNNKRAWTLQGKIMGTINTVIFFAISCFLIAAFIIGQ